MTSRLHRINDNEWDYISHLILNKNESLITKYACIYKFAQKRRLYDIVSIPPDEPLSSIKFADESDKELTLFRSRSILDNLHAIDNRLLKRALSNKYFDYYKIFEYPAMFNKLLNLTHQSFSVLPVPLKTTTRYI